MLTQDLRSSRTVRNLRALAALLIAANVSADQPTDEASAPSSIAVRSYAIMRIETPPVIDGMLDDEVWQLAPPVNNFRQVIPAANADPSERTEMRMLYDHNNLYIGIRCYDSQPGRMVAAQMQRDANVGTDDHITIVIDPFDRARAGFEFQVSAAGGKREGLLETDAETNYDWRVLWNTRVTRDEHGWTAEIAIPFRSIAFDPDAERWIFNIERYIPRTNETIRWSSPLQNTSVRRLAAGGEILGLEDMHQGIGLTIKPYLRADYDFLRESTQLKPGFDLFYNITPTINLAFTVNTDFAETEIDDVVVNLTRFPVFLPEKRDFFLQDARVFEFGGIARSPLPFFSRRIGLVQGEEQEILTGVRLTGRHDNFRFGAMSVQMKEDDELGNKNLSVVRGAWDILEESSIGFIATHGDPARRGDNLLVGMDFNYLHRDPHTGDRLTANFWGMGTYSDPRDEPRSNDDPIAFGARIAMPNEPWRWSVGVQQIGEDFQPALGFVERSDRRVFNSDLFHRWRPQDRNHWVRFIDIGTIAEVWTFMDGEIEAAHVDIPNFQIDTRGNEQYYVRAYYDYEKLIEPFEIIDDVFVPVDSYDTFGFRGGFRTSTSKPAAWRFEGGYRSFYTGYRWDTLARVRLRPSAHFYGGMDYEFSYIDLGFEHFNVHILRMLANVVISPTLSWNNIVQWDSVSENLVLNSRIRWEFQPGQEVFIVYNEGIFTDEGHFRSTVRQATR